MALDVLEHPGTSLTGGQPWSLRHAAVRQIIRRFFMGCPGAHPRIRSDATIRRPNIGRFLRFVFCICRVYILDPGLNFGQLSTSDSFSAYQTCILTTGTVYRCKIWSKHDNNTNGPNFGWIYVWATDRSR